MLAENNNLNKSSPRPASGGASWAVGVRLFTEISGWIVGPIILALFAGKWLDAKFNTEPWLFLALACAGFLITVYGIVKVVRNYTRKIKKQE